MATMLGNRAAEIRHDKATLSEIFASSQGEGAYAGDRHLFVRFAGCHLRCRYCDTPESLERTDQCEVEYSDGSVETLSNPISIADLATVVDRFLVADPSLRMLAITGGEPMLQAPFIVSWLQGRPPGIPVLLETSATYVRGLDALLPFVAAISADIKLPSNTGEAPAWTDHRDFLERCSAQPTARLYVKMPVDDETTEADIRMGARIVHEIAPRAALFVQPITDAASQWRLGSGRLGAAVAAAAREHPHVGFRPQLHKLIGVR